MKTINVEMAVTTKLGPEAFYKEIQSFLKKAGVVAARVEISGSEEELTYEELSRMAEEATKEDEWVEGLVQRANELTEYIQQDISRRKFHEEVQETMDELEEEKFNHEINSIEEWLRRLL